MVKKLRIGVNSIPEISSIVILDLEYNDLMSSLVAGVATFGILLRDYVSRAFVS